MTAPRPAVGSLYLRPNGEAWRCMGAQHATLFSVMDAPTEDQPGPEIHMSIRAASDLPDDAGLIWSPPHE